LSIEGIKRRANKTLRCKKRQTKKREKREMSEEEQGAVAKGVQRRTICLRPLKEIKKLDTLTIGCEGRKERWQKREERGRRKKVEDSEKEGEGTRGRGIKASHHESSTFSPEGQNNASH